MELGFIFGMTTDVGMTLSRTPTQSSF